MYKVVIIDDEPWSRQVVKTLGAWESAKLSVVGEAEDGSQGLELIEKLDPQLVITDMRMPGVEGVKLLQEMNERFPQLKIIVMSGYDDFVYLRQAVQSRAIDYLLKPIDQDELNHALLQCSRQILEEHVHVAATTPWLTKEVSNDINRNRLMIDEVQAYIDANFHEPISLETLANHFYVSKEHLSRTFKASVGDNVSDYILRRKMEKAKELITVHRFPIKKAAYMMGYEDIAYFYRVFKKHFGITPGMLRTEDEEIIST